MKPQQCCNHNCQQGDACPLRATPEEKNDRRQGPNALWRWFWWLLADERSGNDRRKQ